MSWFLKIISYVKWIVQLISHLFINWLKQLLLPDKGVLDLKLLVKIPMIQCLFGIRSMRQTIKVKCLWLTAGFLG